MGTARKLAVLGGLYLAQGLPFGFFTQALPVLMRESGVSLEAIGLASWLALPWGLKFLWAPVVDRWGSRRAWLVTLQAIGVVACASLALVDPDGALAVLVAAVLLTNFVAATQDVATDGLAVAWLGPEERGWGNGLQVAGYRVGMILGGGALLWVFGRFGWSVTFAAMAVGMVLATLPLLASPGVGAGPSAVEGGDTNPWSWLWLPGAARWTAVLMAFKLGDYAATGMVRPWLVDAGWEPDDLGLWMGGVGVGAGLVGAVVGGALVQPLGRARALVGFGLLQAAGLGVYVAAALSGARPELVVAAIVCEHLWGGMATAALFTAMMDASRPARAGTDYTVQASIVVLASVVGSSVGGLVAGRFGYEVAFAAGAVLALAGPAAALVVALPAFEDD